MNKITHSEDDIRLILSSVRALWGSVVPSLRSVSVEFNNNNISWQCIFDERATDEDLELLSCAATEVVADFPDLDLVEITKVIPEPTKIDYLKNIIFMRFEPKISN